MDKKDVTVTIHGRDYRISSFEDPEYTRKLAKYCDILMKKIESSTDSQDYIKLTVLTMLQITHNYFQVEEKGSMEFERLINILDKTDNELAAIDSGDIGWR
ncbi:MAG: hypothetical protein IEMM0002_1588 [bacterium]|nr:MAG: hypothetical protein IEMM0002_1588 [bacterium]